MKVLTIRQPWASLIALGEKRIETRSWRTSYRGPLLIHAGKSIDKGACQEHLIASVLQKHGYTISNLPTGVIIAKVNLVNCLKVKEEYVTSSLKVTMAVLDNKYEIKGRELDFGDYTSGRYAWMLENVEIFKEPVPAKGQLSLWEYKGFK